MATLLALIGSLRPAWFLIRHYFPGVSNPIFFYSLLLADSLILIAAASDLRRNRGVHWVYPLSWQAEVTEHVFFDQASHYVSRALAVLDRAGVRISLDDFGTGCSSLSHLRYFPVHVVKIDQSFIAKMTQDMEVRAIVSAVIDLASSLDIDVVAEGIEEIEQKNFLNEKGCVFGQGHLFGRAVSADEVPHLLRSKQHGVQPRP